MFFKQKKSGEKMLVIDIGSCSVGTAVVSVSKDMSPKILFSARFPVALQNESERGHSIAGVTEALELAMKAAAAEHVSVHRSHIIFSSPWYSSQTITLKKDFDSPKVITRHDIDQLAKDSEKKFSEESHLVGEVVEHRIIRMRLNGYETRDPYNKKAKSIETAFFASVMAKDILESVNRVVEKYFHLRNNEKSSFSLAAFSAISVILPGEHDFLIVDVRGEVTDLSLVTDGVLIKNLSFSQGKNALIKAVADGSGQSANAALSSLKTAFGGGSEPKTQADVIKFTEKFKQTWLQEYANAAKDISVGTIIPPIIFLLVDQDLESFFENMMKESGDNSAVHLLKNLNVTDYLEKTSVATDQFLALESIFATII